jgi:hypothetical protein
MRRFDKTKNIRKANILAEQRYLASKGFITENDNTINIEHFEVEIDEDGTGGFSLPTRVIGTINGVDFELESFRGFNIPHNFHDINDLLEDIIGDGELKVNDEEIDNDEIKEHIASLVGQKHGEDLTKLTQQVSQLEDRNSGDYDMYEADENGEINTQNPEGNNGKRKIVVLVGPPSVGKSTWTKSNFPNAYIINRDDIVEKVASKYGWTYDDMFASPPADAKVGEEDEKYGKVVESPEWMTWADTVFDKVFKANGEVQNIFGQRVKDAHPSGQDIVVDMTNMNPGARKGALKAIEGNEGEYITVAVDFKFAGAEEIIKKMAAKRAEAAKRMGKSKTIPPQAFDRMFKSYEAPSKAEGFDEIISVNNINNLKKALGND